MLSRFEMRSEEREVVPRVGGPRTRASVAAHLDSRLAGYLDESGDLSVGALRRVQSYAVDLIQERMVPEHVHDDWPDFFPLVAALVLASSSPRLGRFARMSSIFEGWGDEPLTAEDRTFLVALLNGVHDRLCRRRTQGHQAR